MRASRVDCVLTVRVARMRNLGAALKLGRFSTKFQLDGGVCEINVKEAKVRV